LPLEFIQLSFDDNADWNDPNDFDWLRMGKWRSIISVSSWRKVTTLSRQARDDVLCVHGFVQLCTETCSANHAEQDIMLSQLLA
jgi:hypothetical protein